MPSVDTHDNQIFKVAELIMKTDRWEKRKANRKKRKQRRLRHFLVLSELLLMLPPEKAKSGGEKVNLI